MTAESDGAEIRMLVEELNVSVDYRSEKRWPIREAGATRATLESGPKLLDMPDRYRVDDRLLAWKETVERANG